MPADTPLNTTLRPTQHLQVSVVKDVKSERDLRGEKKGATVSKMLAAESNEVSGKLARPASSRLEAGTQLYLAYLKAFDVASCDAPTLNNLII